MTKNRFPILLILLLLLLLNISACKTEDDTDDVEMSSLIGSITPADKSSTATLKNSISITFKEAMDASTITTNTADTNCTGSIQVSADNFATCVQMADQPTADSAALTFTLTPAANFQYCAAHKIKITSAAYYNFGLGFYPEYISPNGFSTQISYSGTGTDIIDSSAIYNGANLSCSFDLGASTKDIYFVMTNDTSSDIASPTRIISSVNTMLTNNYSFNKKTLYSDKESIDLIEYARDNGIGLRGIPAATNFKPNLIQDQQTSFLGNLLFLTPSEPVYSSLEDTHTFKNSSTTDTISATLKKIITDGTITLNLWVSNDSWDTGCGKAYCLTQTMIDSYGNQFLQSGSNNDIYDWISNVYGVPWGNHNYPTQLIDSSAALQIDILFFDISNDNSTTGGYLGFSWSKDNYLSSSINYSNERLIFYMDSVLSATPEGGTWEISDEWPAEMVSTLAHEFQHMIHFYQKTIAQADGKNTDTYLNEMMSMVAEDLIATKLQVNGPRGVSYADGTAGSADNDNGRLPRYNYHNYIGISDWSNSLSNYAINYAFGAYLVRNFGGATLLQKIMQNDKTDFQMVTTALSELGYNESTGSILQKWGIAVVQSDETSDTAGYQYNIKNYYTSTLNSIDYKMGSINMHNYKFRTLTGPQFFTPSDISSQGGHFKMSNTFILAGDDRTGAFTQTVSKSDKVTLSIVIK